LEEEFLEWEEENLKREYEKLKGKFEDRKIMEKLLRKGFRYDDIMRLKKIKKFPLGIFLFFHGICYLIYHLIYRI
jgi:hypothetical protein